MKAVVMLQVSGIPAINAAAISMFYFDNLDAAKAHAARQVSQYKGAYEALVFELVTIASVPTPEVTWTEAK